MMVKLKSPPLHSLAVPRWTRRERWTQSRWPRRCWRQTRPSCRTRSTAATLSRWSPNPLRIRKDCSIFHSLSTLWKVRAKWQIGQSSQKVSKLNDHSNSKVLKGYPLSSSLCVHSSIHKTFYGSLTFRVITIRGHSGMSFWGPWNTKYKDTKKRDKTCNMSLTLKKIKFQQLSTTAES